MDDVAIRLAPLHRVCQRPAPATGSGVWLAACVLRYVQRPPDRVGPAGFRFRSHHVAAVTLSELVIQSMDPLLPLRGLALGFAIAAPVGPIGVLCIQRTLRRGRVIGLVTGLGAATADACYGGLAAFGLTALSSLLIGARLWIHLIGGIFLLYLGVRTVFAHPARKAAAVRDRGLVGAYTSTLALTLANPATILSFAAVFSGIGVGLMGGRGGFVSAALVTCGIFAGSSLWWLLLSSGVSLLRTRLNENALRWVGVASGAVLIGFAVAALGTA